MCHALSFLPLTFDQALARDGFRCMVTGMFDDTSLNKSAELRSIHESLDGGMPITVETCHILNESTTQGIGTGDKSTVVNCRVLHNSFSSPITQTYYAAGVLATLRQFGLEDLAMAFEAVDGVHEFWNLLSLEHHLHQRFDHLDLWFEGISKVRHPETFRLC